jgi:hypothetical protein
MLPRRIQIKNTDVFRRKFMRMQMPGSLVRLFEIRKSSRYDQSHDGTSRECTRSHITQIAFQIMTARLPCGDRKVALRRPIMTGVFDTAL